ncbi:hypothetical protein ANCCAN_17191 [Ancylostoma caninum]|uniref:Uncharacterized protein n=1 Tax=Ancylostoma caninum TaxID=29170 RepID=A0A368FZN9_ANCCA|nr:hypothetical protein ANCCAN_17191 [Ancylostoma caninum]
MKDYHISAVEFPSDGQTAKQHTLVVDMDKSSIYTITKDSSSHAKTPKAMATRLWTEHRKAILIAFVVFALIVIFVLLALVAWRVVGS